MPSRTLIIAKFGKVTYQLAFSIKVPNPQCPKVGPNGIYLVIVLDRNMTKIDQWYELRCHGPKRIYSHSVGETIMYPDKFKRMEWLGAIREEKEKAFKGSYHTIRRQMLLV